MKLLQIFLCFSVLFNAIALPSLAEIKLFTASKKSKTLKLYTGDAPIQYTDRKYYFVTDPNNKPTPVEPWHNHGSCGIWTTCWEVEPYTFPVVAVPGVIATNKCGIFTLPKSKSGWLGIYRVTYGRGPDWGPFTSQSETIYEGPVSGITFDSNNYVCKYPQSANFQLIVKPRN